MKGIFIFEKDFCQDGTPRTAEDEADRPSGHEEARMKDDKAAGREKAAGRGTAGPHPYTAPALEKGLDILELLADAGESLSQNQIAAGLGRSIGEIFRMLEVLERRGWIFRSAASGTYRLSMRMFELAHRQPQIRQLVAVALPLMQRLAQETRQSNHLVVHHDRRILVVAQVDSPEAMGFSVRVGAHFPFRVDRVSARTYSAFQPPQRRQELIDEMIANDPSPPSRASLQRQVAAIARRGFEEKESDTLPGITDICCPIVDRTGFAIATLTQPYLRQRDVHRSVPQARAAQLQAVAAISRELGASLPAAPETPGRH
jgi:DNA-binding IclR family transcriptional regulator